MVDSRSRYRTTKPSSSSKAAMSHAQFNLQYPSTSSAYYTPYAPFNPNSYPYVQYAAMNSVVPPSPQSISPTGYVVPPPRITTGGYSGQNFSAAQGLPNQHPHYQRSQQLPLLHQQHAYSLPFAPPLHSATPHQPGPLVWQAHAHQPVSSLPKQSSSPPSPLPPPKPQSTPPSPSRSSLFLLPSSSQPPQTPSAWTIWSRRPTNPSQAPGVIISRLARPPPEIVEMALDLPTPPASPILGPHFDTQAPDDPPSELTATQHINPDVDVEAEAGAETEQNPTLAGGGNESLSISETNVLLHVPLSSTNSSCAASAMTPSTQTPPSPLSSNTSLSQAKEPTSPTSQSLELKPASASAPAPASSPTLVPQKKSWASLLRTPADAKQGANGLPTSSVVGYSIPAFSSSTATPSIPASFSPRLVSLLTGQVSISESGSMASARNAKVRGIINTGNMCFANAVLQVLVHCEPFWHFFGEGLSAVNLEEGTVKTPLVEATVKFLKEFVIIDEKDDVGGKGKARARDERESGDRDDKNETEAFIPSYVYNAMKEKKRFDSMRGGQQEDAEEFLGFYLDALEEELLALLESISPSPRSHRESNSSIHKPPLLAEEHEEVPPPDDQWFEVGKRNRTVITRTIKTVESPISRIFGGKLKSTLRAPGQKDSVIVEDWRSLRLDIQRDTIHSLKDALHHISTPQSVSINLPSSTTPIEASQQVLIDSLPPILVLHMKRFLYDTQVGGVVKLGKQISFGQDLEVGGEIMTPAARKAPPTKYKLFGVLHHHGLSASGGHYTLDVLHPNRSQTMPPREGWVRIDDEQVWDVNTEDVFGDGGGESSRCAYLLFYQRLPRPAAATR